MRITAIPQIYRHVNRWGEIFSVLSKYGLANWVGRLGPDFAKDMFRGPGGAAIARLPWEMRIRLALAELGPTFIKLGQVLSTRPDLIGVSLADELTQLQTGVQADPPDVVRRTILQELGRPVEELFDDFDDVPLASASIGQVHRARLKSGELVAIKVQRSDIQRKVAVDTDILNGLAQLAESRLPEFQNYRPRAIAEEFQRTTQRELDFHRELRHMQQFAQDFAGDSTLCIPRPYPELSTARVLTMQYLEGIKLSDTAALTAAGYDLGEIARRGARIYLEMIFSHGFYHADPHPGNVLVMDRGVFGLLDHGMVGRMDERLHDNVEELLLAVTSLDAEHLTSIIVRLGSVPQDLDRAGLSVDVSDFVSHYGAQRLEDLDLSGALREMVEMVRRYHIHLPARVAMLIKTLVTLEGTARLLSPHFSLLEIMKPYRRKMILRRLSPTRRLRRFQRLYSDISHMAEVLPQGIVDIVEQMRDGVFDVHLDHRGLEPSVNRLVLGMLASALIVGSSLLMAQAVPPALGGVSLSGVLGFAMAFFLGVRLLRAINKSGHLDRRAEIQARKKPPAR